MNCLICKSGTLREATNTYFANLKYGYVIIENVPCLKCDQCGEVIYSASVMEKIDNMLEQMQKITSRIFIVDYANAA
ncbi:MAG: type II toxin-antitoxin system MqsA family antitoxin [Selenomonadaceae bacterium]|nr:type II toxin-antitoxin system MqsA family antitoxin [Selenomonadaceae bacterium]